MAAKMRAKFLVTSVQEMGSSEEVKFSAVSKSDGYPEDGSDDDNTYARWSPMAECKIMIANPALHGKLIVGEKYYVDFTPAE